MEEIVKLVIDSKTYQGWQEVGITSSLENACSHFTLTCSDNQRDGQPIIITPGQSCLITINDAVVITGYIDSVDIDYDAYNHSITVSGRSKTRDAVDCSQMHLTGNLIGMDLLGIANTLCANFPFAVIKTTDVGAPFPSFMCEIGQTSYDAIELGARLRAVLITDDENGNLVICGVGTNGTGSLKTKIGADDNNILSCKALSTIAERYSEIHVRAQGIGNDALFGLGVNQQEAIARDPSIKSYRPLVKILEHGGTVQDAQLRANWEIAHRGGNGTHFRCSVQGWRQADGTLWKKNALVNVDDDIANIHDQLVIGSVNYEISEKGTICNMTLKPKQAYVPDPTFKDPRLAQWAGLFNK